jgi:predicted dehydrogenase
MSDTQQGANGTMQTYRAAVVGLTGISTQAAPAAPDPVLGTVVPHSHVASYASVPATELVAVCDLVPDLLDGFQRQWGERFPNAKPYTDYRAMLAEQKIDLLSVVTSDHRHAEIVIDGVAAGVRGIFCEKPLATTLADADRMIAACEAKQVPMLINHTRRWFPEFVEARRMLRDGELGALRRIVATLGGERAMLFRNGTHLVDTICFFADSDPAWLVAELDDEHRDHPPRYAGDGGRDPATDPGVSAFIHFENGVRAFVNASKGTFKAFEIELICERGRVRVGAEGAEWSQLMPNGRLGSGQLTVPQTTRSDSGAAILELIDLIERGGAPSSSGADGKRTLSILLAMLQSNAAGSKRIDFPVTDA